MSRLRLCCVGDSITSGQGDSHFLGWPGRIGQRALAAGQDCTIYNLGVRGETTHDGAQRWKAECSARLPRDSRCAVLFAFGINDATSEAGVRRVPLEETRANATSMLRQAKERGWSPLWIGPAPVDESRQPMVMDNGVVRDKSNVVTAEYDLAIQAVAAAAGAPYLDLLRTLSSRRAWAASALSDGLHPNAAGYEDMAAAIWDWPAFQTLLS